MVFSTVVALEKRPYSRLLDFPFLLTVLPLSSDPDLPLGWVYSPASKGKSLHLETSLTTEAFLTGHSHSSLLEFLGHGFIIFEEP
jgi:hypothetical protein